jgi:hypothetical protein
MYSSEEKKILEALHLRSEDNIEVDFQEFRMGGGGAGLIDLAQDMDMLRAVMNPVVNRRMP